MALQSTVTLAEFGGLAVADAYISISSVGCDKRRGEWQARIQGNIYLSAAAKAENNQPIASFNHSFEMSVPLPDANILVVAYARIKADLFPAAIDV